MIALWQLLLQWDQETRVAYHVLWHEFVALLHEVDEVEFPAICPRTGRWIAANWVPFRPSGLTFAVQIGLVRKAFSAGMRKFGLENFLVRGSGAVKLGIHCPVDGFFIGPLLVTAWLPTTPSC